jgi:hypothetical protein
MPIRGLQEALTRAGVPGIENLRSGPLRHAARIAFKCGMVRTLTKSSGNVITMASWGRTWPAFPQCLTSNVVPWVYDCWGPQIPLWHTSLRRLRCTHIFCSAKLAIDRLREGLPRATFHWLPEAADPNWYNPKKSLAERSVSLLEIGRRHPRFHASAKPVMEHEKLTHLYAEGDEYMFHNATGLHAVLADTVALCCYPKTSTHPKEAGGIETFTLRYFEAIANRCICVGTCPRELIDLFGFNPVIEVNPDTAGEQLREVLRAPDAYQSHVDRCYARYLEVGTFDHRVREMLAVLSA